MLLGKDKLNVNEVLISKALIDSYICRDKFVLVNNVFSKYNEMKEEIKKYWNFCGIYHINMVDISRKMCERYGIETMVDNDGTLWLNEKHIEEGLDHKNVQEITIKYHSDHRKHRYELVDKPKKQYNRILIDEKLAIKVIIDCRTTSAHKFRARLGFKQYDVILTKERSVLTKIISSFEGENIQAQYNVLSYRIDISLHALEFDENGHSDRNIDYKIKRQKQ